MCYTEHYTLKPQCNIHKLQITTPHEKNCMSAHCSTFHFVCHLRQDSKVIYNHPFTGLIQGCTDG